MKKVFRSGTFFAVFMTISLAIITFSTVQGWAAPFPRW